jgi:nucleotide-binding universal stress UspA family protein
VINIQRILCPIDYSDFSRRALEHAVAIARWYGSTVTAFHVSAVIPAAAFAPGMQAVTATPLTLEGREAMLAALERFVGPEIRASGVPLEYDVVEGGAAAEILAKAKAMPSDLIVLGTHGYSGFDRLVLGSVTEKVLRKAACPVLTVPAQAPDDKPSLEALFKRILCAVDLSDCSLAALRYAISLAKEADAHLTILSVVDLPLGLWPDAERAPSKLPADLRAYIETAERDREKALAGLIPADAGTYCTIDTAVMTGTPYRRILTAATDAKAGLLVMGVRGRGAADLLLFGSTVQHVVRQAACPVLTIRG